MSTRHDASTPPIGRLFATRTWLLCTILAATALLSCAKAPVMEPPAPTPTVVTVAITSATALNPDSSGRSSPVTLRVYQLTDASSFSKADLLDLWDRETPTLAAALVARLEFNVAPGGAANGSFELRPGVRQIGVAVGFRDFRNAAWRFVIPVPEPPPKTPTALTLSIELNDKSVSAHLQAAMPQPAGAAK